MLGDVLADIAAGNIGLDDLSKIIRQIDRIVGAEPGKPPSVYSIAKLLLILSGDTDEPANRPPARKGQAAAVVLPSCVGDAPLSGAVSQRSMPAFSWRIVRRLCAAHHRVESGPRDRWSRNSRR